MSAKNFSTAQFGAFSEATATGLYVNDISYSYESEKVDLKNHISNTVGFTLTDDKTNIKLSGAVITKGTGIIPSIASVIVLANSTGNSLTLNSDGIFTTPIANAGVVVIGSELKRVNDNFETGDLTAIFHPLTATNAVVTID
jgi:hypothetical protein